MEACHSSQHHLLYIHRRNPIWGPESILQGQSWLPYLVIWLGGVGVGRVGARKAFPNPSHVTWPALSLSLVTSSGIRALLLLRLSSAEAYYTRQQGQVWI